MKTLFRWTARLLLAVVALIIIVPLAATLLIDKDDIRERVDRLVFDTTGRHLRIEGPLGLTPGLQLGVYAEDIRYENASWASKPSAITVDRLSAKVSLLAALRGTVQVDEVRINGYEMWIERSEGGQINLAEPSGEPKQEPGPIPLPDWLALGAVRALDSRIVSLVGENDFEIALDRVDLDSGDRAGPLRIYGEVQLQKTPFVVSGVLGSLESWLGRTSSPADLEFAIAGRGRVGAKGSVGDVLAWSDVAVDLSGQLEALNALSPLVPEVPIAIEDIQLSGKIVQPGPPSTMAARALEGSLRAAGIKFALDGAIEGLAVDQQFDLGATGKGELDRNLLPANFPDAVQPVVDLSARLGGTSRTPSLSIESASVVIDGAQATLDGNIRDLAGDWGEPLSLTVDVDNLRDIASSFSINLPALGGVAGSASLARTESGFSLAGIALENRNSAAALAVSGGLDQLGPEASGRLEIDANIQPEFFSESEIDIPIALEPMEGQATFEMDNGAMRLGISEASTTLPGATLTASGAIPDLRQPTDLRIDLVGQILQLDELGTVLDQSLPAIRNIGVDAALVGSDDAWHLREIEANKEQQDGLRVAATGGIENLGESLTAEINFEGELSMDRLGRLVPDAAATLEPVKDELGDIEITGMVVAASASAWALKAVEAHSAWMGVDLDVNGDINGFSPLDGGFSIALKGEPEAQSALLSNYPIPELDTIDVSLDLALPVAENGIKNLQGRITADTATLAFSGDIRQLNPLAGEGFNISLQAAEASSLVPQGKVFASGNPVDINVDVALDPGEISVGGKVQLGQSNLDGSVSYLSGEERKPAIRAVVNSDRVDINSLLAKPDKQADPIPEVKPDQKTTRLFSDERLVPAFADTLDLDLKLNVTALDSNVLSLRDLTGTVSTRQGMLNADLSGKNGDGSMEVEVKLSEGGANIINADINQLSLDAVGAVSESKILSGGTADIRFNLSGNANSIAGLLENGKGGLTLDIRNSRMANTALGAVGGDLFTNVLSAVNPFDKKSDTVGVECIAMRLNIGDGKIRTEQGLAMKTDTVTLLGGGEVSLPSEQMRIAIAPKARKGLGVSATSIAKMVRIGGTLSSPSVETDATGLLKSGAAIGAALASGGLSLFAQGILDRFRANSDVCAIARGDKERSETEARVSESGVK